MMGQGYWQIVESRRVDGKLRPVVLMDLGTARSYETEKVNFRS
jgi:hypothetical protein